MSIKDAVQNLLGGSDSPDANDDSTDGPPSHVCQSCGEEYYTDPEIDVDTCRTCGGIKVERV